MNSAERLPILYRADTVILGGSTQAVEEALRLTRSGVRVVLITESSFLGTEICMTADYPEGAIPDELKKELEENA